MTSRAGRVAGFLRAYAVAAVGAVTFVALAVGVYKVVRSDKEAGKGRKEKVFQVVNVQLQQPKPTPPPPEVQPKLQPKIEDEPQTTRVSMKSLDMPPPDMARPAPGGGRLSLASEGEGPGDAFNLSGNPGGKGLLSGGGLGDGSGDGIGGEGSDEARFGWYYRKIAGDLEEALRRNRVLKASATRVEVRVWADPGGTIRDIQLIQSTGDPDVDDAIRSYRGLRIREAPPADVPMPMIIRVTARKPR